MKKVKIKKLRSEPLIKEIIKTKDYVSAIGWLELLLDYMDYGEINELIFFRR